MTATIPIVVLSSDLVGQGLVQSLAHPGGNITGVAVDAGPSIWGKRIALLREMVPAIAKLAFVNPAAFKVKERAVQAAAEAAGIALILGPIKYPAAEADYHAAIEAASRQGADSVLFPQHPQTIEFAALLAELAAKARFPAIYPFRENVEAGGLMSYSEDMADLFRRAGDAIAAILDGASPADIPVYQASRFFLTINLKSARARPRPAADPARSRRGCDRMRRRTFLAGLAAAVWPHRARAQPRMPRIGYLGLAPADPEKPLFEAFEAALGELGYVPGKTIEIEFRTADGRGEDRMAELARELVDLKVDIIVTGGPGVYCRAQGDKHGSDRHAAFGEIDELVAMGIVARSLAHPGGTVTGETFFSASCS